METESEMRENACNDRQSVDGTPRFQARESNFRITNDLVMRGGGEREPYMARRSFVARLRLVPMPRKLQAATIWHSFRDTKWKANMEISVEKGGGTAVL